MGTLGKVHGAKWLLLLLVRWDIRLQATKFVRWWFYQKHNICIISKKLQVVTKATNQETDPEKHWPSEFTLIKPGHQSVLVTSRKEVACLPSHAGTDRLLCTTGEREASPGLGLWIPSLILLSNLCSPLSLPGEHLCIIK